MTQARNHLNKQVSTNQSALAYSQSERKGLLYAALAIPAGVFAWAVLWSMGFIASLVAFGIGWLALYLFVLGAGGEPMTKNARMGLVAIIILGIVLSFIGGIVLDAEKFVSEETKLSFWQVMTTGSFWSFVGDIIRSAELWKDYGKDAAMAVVFGALGSFGIIKALLTPTTTTSAKK